MTGATPFVVALTGGIGSGKSAAADGFARLGASVVDTDVIAHTLTAPDGSAIAPLVAAFGASFLTPEGALDRAAMRRRIFASSAERIRLEAILHPLIRAEAETQVRRLGSAGLDSYVILVVPLLTETGGWRDRVDRVAVVDCPEETQLARVMARNKLPREQVQTIMATQATREARRAIADDVIDNTRGRTELKTAVVVLHERYRALACERKKFLLA